MTFGGTALAIGLAGGLGAPRREPGRTASRDPFRSGSQQFVVLLWFGRQVSEACRRLQGCLLSNSHSIMKEKTGGAILIVKKRAAESGDGSHKSLRAYALELAVPG